MDDDEFTYVCPACRGSGEQEPPCCDAAAKLARIREAAAEVCNQGISAMQVDNTGGPTFFLKDALAALRREIEG